MAGGTGDVAFRMARRGAHVTVADINADMLEVGRQRAERRELAGLEWKVENAETLSFADASFDAYTIVFGIRNVTDIPAALREAHRVLKRGGRFYCMEFSSSDWPGFAELYEAYASNVIPRIGKVVADDEESYRYLVESIRRFPKPAAFKAMVGRGGLRPRRGRADARRPGDHPFGLEDLTTSVTHLWRLLKWGRTLARHGALRGIEEDPLTPPPGSPARAHRPLRRADPADARICGGAASRSVRRRSSSARRCRRGPTSSAKKRAAQPVAAPGRPAAGAVREDQADDRELVRRTARQPVLRGSTKCRSAPPRSPRSIAR